VYRARVLSLVLSESEYSRIPIACWERGSPVRTRSRSLTSEPMEGLAAESMSADLEQMKEKIRELMNMVTTMMSAQITENPAQTQQPQQAIPSQSIPVGPGSSQVTGTTTEIPTPAQNPIFLAIPDHQEVKPD